MSELNKPLSKDFKDQQAYTMALENYCTNLEKFGNKLTQDIENWKLHAEQLHEGKLVMLREKVDLLSRLPQIRYDALKEGTTSIRAYATKVTEERDALKLKLDSIINSGENPLTSLKGVKGVKGESI